jgi:hypothetical protein
VVEIAPAGVRGSGRYRIVSLTSQTRDLGAGPTLAGVQTRSVERTISATVLMMVARDTMQLEMSLARQGAVAPSLLRADPYMLASGGTRLGAAVTTALLGAVADSAERFPGTVRGPLLQGTQTLRLRGHRHGRSAAEHIVYHAVDSVRVDTLTLNSDVAAAVRIPGPRTTLIELMNGVQPARGLPGGPKRKDPVRGGPVCH